MISWLPTRLATVGRTLRLKDPATGHSAIWVITKVHGQIDADLIVPVDDNWCGEGFTTTWPDEFAEAMDKVDAERRARDIEARSRGTMAAMTRPDGWTKCPYCKMIFSTRSRESFDGARHISCGTYLDIIPAGPDAY